MARKRMFASDLIESDQFILLSHEAQLLYFHLSLKADDEGFLRSHQVVLKMLDISSDALEELICTNLVHRFESGIVLILDWNQHNHIRKDRFIPTTCQQERQFVRLDNNGLYHISSHCCESDGVVTTICQASDNQMETQYRTDKNRTGKKRENPRFLREEKTNSNNVRIGLVL